MFRFFDDTNKQNLERLEASNNKLDAILNETIKRNNLNIPVESKPRQELYSKETCKDTLKFLDYLRKSQCAKTTYSESFGHRIPIPTSECQRTLAEMEKLANECVLHFGYKQ